jgi:hypothetical protein
MPLRQTRMRGMRTIGVSQRRSDSKRKKERKKERKKNLLGVFDLVLHPRCCAWLIHKSIYGLGMGYVQSLFEPHEAKNAGKKSTCSYVAFAPEAFVATHFPPLRGVRTPCACSDSVLGGSGFPPLPCPVPILFWVGRGSLPCLADCPAGNFFHAFSRLHWQTACVSASLVNSALHR